MNHLLRLVLPGVVAACALLAVQPAHATEVAYRDFGDAPEGAHAYPGVPGHFPTCTGVTSPGTQEIAYCCPLVNCPAISTLPGFTGFVEHLAPAGHPVAFWLGCGAVPPGGVDGEDDGRTNHTGEAGSACDPLVTVDCTEGAFGLSFGQDECMGDGLDAGVQGPLTFPTCTPSSVTFDAYNAGAAPAVAYLNILVDWNRDGDWNDSFLCPDHGCAYEWAVKNASIVLEPGCRTLTSPSFLSAPMMSEEGEGWLRITISERPAADDFPWDGTANGAEGPFLAGETEDYTVHFESGPCEVAYEDFGDAPEDIAAYPDGTQGHFPTCLYGGVSGTQEIGCGTPKSTPPGGIIEPPFAPFAPLDAPSPTGHVRHVALPSDMRHFWLGCGMDGVDSESDGKTEVSPAWPLTSHCDPSVSPDCVEVAISGMTFAQDERMGGIDAGVSAPIVLPRCGLAHLDARITSCGPIEITVYVNILGDWNDDADWNDNISCSGVCAYEWAVKNQPVTLAPGCHVYALPTFRTGSSGHGWMRVTLTTNPVPNDFPWNGSVSAPGGTFSGGETEDYTVIVSTTSAGDPDMPASIRLDPTWPNPGRTFTLVRYALPREARVDLAVFDVGGRRVRTLTGGVEAAGEHAVRWDHRTDEGGRTPAGLYLVALTAEGNVLTRRAIRID